MADDFRNSSTIVLINLPYCYD